MRIGVMTYWQTYDNYGQLLQCYALQQTLEEMGHEPYVIRYDIDNRKHTVPFLKRMTHLLLFPIYIMRLRRRRKAYRAKIRLEQRRCFDDFRASHFRFSPILYTSLQGLKAQPPQADCYIAGSDQVWGQLLSEPENEAYFLNFGDKMIKRISFAASFGMEEYPAKLNDRLKRNLSRFDCVSCRESAGIKICANVGIKAVRAIDPTLLIEPDIYEQLMSGRLCKTEYVFIYSINIDKSEELRYSELKRFAKSHNWETIVTVGSGYMQGKEIYDDVMYSYATVGQWLSYIKNASLIVTPSFHGIAFSILFHRPFVYIPLHGHASKGNNRVLELLKDLGLEKHTLKNDVQYERLACMPFDWELADNKLQQLQNEAKAFLMDALTI